MGDDRRGTKIKYVIVIYKYALYMYINFFHKIEIHNKEYSNNNNNNNNNNNAKKEERQLNTMMTVEEYNDLLDWMYSTEDAENQVKRDEGGGFIVNTGVKIYEKLYEWFAGK